MLGYRKVQGIGSCGYRIDKGKNMKEGIHPFYPETTISCACGNVIQTRAAKEGIKIEICSNCHPFFTGKQRLMDTEGRVERFLNKYKKK